MATFNEIRGSNGSGEAARATVQAIRLSGSTSLNVDGVTNWHSPFIATYGTPDGNGSITPSSLRVFHGTVSGSDIAITSFAAGYTDNGNSVGDIVVLKPSTEWANELADTLEGIAEGTLIDSNAVTAAKIASNAVTTVKIANNAVTASKIDFTTFSSNSSWDSGWINVTFQNGYSNQGGTTVSYRKIGGVVYLRGQPGKATLDTNAIFTLPAGYRPSIISIFTVPGGANNSTKFVINSDGTANMTPVATSSTYIGLDSVSFIAA